MPFMTFSRQWLISDKPIVRVETHPPKKHSDRDDGLVVLNLDDEDDLYIGLSLDEAESMGRLILDAVMDARMGRYTES